MRLLLLFLTAVLISVNVFSQAGLTVQVIDSTLSVHGKGRILLANAGFAPVPAFSFNSPIVIGSLSLKKRLFSYDPDFSLGLNGKPWMANNWFRFAFIHRKKIRSAAGINPSLFFKSERAASGEDILHAQRNITFEWTAENQFSTAWSLRLTYMHVHAFDRGALTGNFFDVSSAISVVCIPEIISIQVKPQLFYFDFEGNVDGFFSSVTVNIDHQEIPLSIYVQGVLPLWTGFSGNNFKWTTGIVYAF